MSFLCYKFDCKECGKEHVIPYNCLDKRPFKLSFKVPCLSNSATHVYKRKDFSINILEGSKYEKLKVIPEGLEKISDKTC